MPRSTKVIDNEITPLCSSHPSESKESPTVIQDSQPTFLVNKDNEDSSLNCSKLSQSQTLPIGLYDTEEKRTKTPKVTRKESQHSQKTACTLLIALTNLTQHFQPEPLSTIQVIMHLWTLHKLCMMKLKVRERKNQL